MADLLVVGSGLIGTSVAMALRGTRDVLLSDTDQDAVQTALRRTGARAWDGREQAALVLVAVPLPSVTTVLLQLERLLPDSTFTHVSSAQAQVEGEIETSGFPMSRFCGGHPMAGREVSGPAAARAELFAGRTWVVCPAPRTSPAARQAVLDLAAACGATPLVRGAEEHDAAVARVSHAPQVVASALAAQLLGAPEATSLAGPGLQDTTRIASAPAPWWLDVLRANAHHVAPLLRRTAAELEQAAAALDRDDPDPVRDLLARGAAGRELLPRKRGVAEVDLVPVAVDVPDRPGQLAALFVAAQEIGVNVEDVRVDHVPGTPRGTVELLVRREQAGLLRAALSAGGRAVLPG